MMSCSVAARSGSAADAGSWSALDVTIVRILTIVADSVNCRHARSASARHQAHAPDLNVARATTAGYGQSSQFLELLDAAVLSVVSTIRSEGVRWTVAWDSQSGASAA